MESEDRNAPGGLNSKLDKTKTNFQWIASQIENLKTLNPNTEYLKILNNYEIVSEGIHKVKETLDPMFDHYEAVPKKILGADKPGISVSLLGVKRDEGLVKNETKIIKDNLAKLFGTTQQEIVGEERKMNNVFKQVCIRSDSCRDTCKGLLGKIEQRAKKLKTLRRINKNVPTTYKGDYMVCNENNYQKKIDQVYALLKLGPNDFKIISTVN
mmetsp:Transcript_32673/g.28932  ORF Transcript_32673/g.28932 Transcript_32673/m.28932 type:complete len:212 (-) Transcript_32673:214-849(-)